MHEELAVIIYSVAIALVITAIARWCEGRREAADVAPTTPAMWSPRDTAALTINEQPLGALLTPIAHAQRPGYVDPIPCEFCGVGDIRKASFAIPLVDEEIVVRNFVGEVIVYRSYEMWCLDCAPLATNGWLRAGPPEARRVKS